VPIGIFGNGSLEIDGLWRNRYATDRPFLSFLFDGDFIDFEKNWLRNVGKLIAAFDAINLKYPQTDKPILY
jgi:hypothetical protein